MKKGKVCKVKHVQGITLAHLKLKQRCSIV